MDDMAHRFTVAQTHRLALEAGQIEGFGKRLEALDPLRVLERGYAVVTRREDNILIRKVSQARNGIRVRVSDGAFDAEVENRKS